MFLEVYNDSLNNNSDGKRLYKWLKADQRFEFDRWNDRNDLSKLNCKQRMILFTIDETLKANNPKSGDLMKVVKSPSSPDVYGVVARKMIHCDTFLGFFEGNFVADHDHRSVKGPGKYYGLANPNTDHYEKNIGHIDGSAFDSCYARYFVSNQLPSLQNVSVVRLKGVTDCNRAICFVSNGDIAKGTELLIAPDQDYSRNRSKRVVIKPPSLTLEQIAIKAGLFNH
jgi:hypothetical protein